MAKKVKEVKPEIVEKKIDEKDDLTLRVEALEASAVKIKKQLEALEALAVKIKKQFGV